MKNLLIFLLLLSVGGLFFHDRQETADLAKAQDENSQLAQQLSEKTQAYNALDAKIKQLSAQLGVQMPASPSANNSRIYSVPSAPRPGVGAVNGQDPTNPLDRGAYH